MYVYEQDIISINERVIVSEIVTRIFKDTVLPDSVKTEPFFAMLLPEEFLHCYWHLVQASRSLLTK